MTVPCKWLLLSREKPEGDDVMLLMDSVGVWSEERSSSCDSEWLCWSLELRMGDRWWEYVPVLDILEGRRAWPFSLVFLDC